MSPGRPLSEPSFNLCPIEKSPKDKSNYGAVITGLDLNEINGKLHGNYF
jgi:xanthine dioxygenase